MKRLCEECEYYSSAVDRYDRTRDYFAKCSASNVIGPLMFNRACEYERSMSLVFALATGTCGKAGRFWKRKAKQVTEKDRERATRALGEALDIDYRQLMWQAKRIEELAKEFVDAGKDFEPKDIIDAIKMEQVSKPWEK